MIFKGLRLLLLYCYIAGGQGTLTKGAVRFYTISEKRGLNKQTLSLYKQPTDKEIYSPVRSGSHQGYIQPWLIREPSENKQPGLIREPSGKGTALSYKGTIRKINNPV